MDKICDTIGERPCQMLTITDPVNLIAKKSKISLKNVDDDDEDDAELVEEDGNDEEMRAKVVVILGRSNPGESCSSFIIQGFIDFLTSQHSVAICLRNYIIFKIIPVMNPDGVFLGNSRVNLLGKDLNRCWPTADKYTTPTLFHTREMIERLDSENVLDMVLDIHAHSSLFGLFIVGNSYGDVYRFERHIVFPKILAKNCPDSIIEKNMYNNDGLKEGSARRFFCQKLSSEVNSYSLEASIYGYMDNENNVVYYSDESYARIGRNVARAMWDYYKIMGTIPMDSQSSTDYDRSSSVALRPKSAMSSFNLLRLREIDNQREETLMSFDFNSDDDVISSVSATANSKEFIKPPLEVELVTKEEEEDDSGKSSNGEDDHKSWEMKRKITEPSKVQFTEFADGQLGLAYHRRRKTVPHTPSVQISSNRKIPSNFFSYNRSRTKDYDRKLSRILNHKDIVGLDVTGLGNKFESKIYNPTISTIPPKKVGGGGLISSRSAEFSLRPQSLKPATEGNLLSVIDFSEISQKSIVQRPNTNNKKLIYKRINQRPSTATAL